jgi:hypothetical protein
VALGLVLVVCAAAYWAVERHTAQLMRHPVWKRFDNGITGGLVASAREAVRRRADDRAPDSTPVA